MPVKNHTGSRTVSDEVCLYPRSITVFVKIIVWQKIRVTKESTLEIRFPFSRRHPIFLPLYILDSGGNSWELVLEFEIASDLLKKEQFT